LVVKQENFINAHFFSFLTLFILRRDSAAKNQKKQIGKSTFQFGQAFGRSGCVGVQNARKRVRFDKIFASFSSIGKGRASLA
jgi:hypothetical protein